MRKEQHRAFQEGHKSNPVKQRDGFDILMQLDEAKDDKKLLNTSSGFDEPISLQSSKNDRETFFPSQTTVSRPLVPPGFTSTVLEKNFGTRSSVNPRLLEVIIRFHHIFFGFNSLEYKVVSHLKVVNGVDMCLGSVFLSSASVILL